MTTLANPNVVGREVALWKAVSRNFLDTTVGGGTGGGANALIPTAVVFPEARVRYVEIGSDSQINQVYIRPANGHEMLVGVGAPMPYGDWEEPFMVRPAQGVIAAADLNGIDKSLRESYLSLIGKNYIPPFVPAKRVPERRDAVDLAVANGAAITYAVPTWGRHSLRFDIKNTGANAFSYTLTGWRWAPPGANQAGSLLYTSGAIAANAFDGVSLANLLFDMVVVTPTGVGVSTARTWYETRD